MKLTSTAINGFTFTGKSAGRDAKDLRWDDEIPGFGVRVWPSGKKTFFVVYRFRGRERFMSLGAYGVITLPQARDLARAVKVQVASGNDPLRERKQRNEGQTFADLAKVYLERHAAQKRSGDDDEAMLRLHLLPALGSAPLATISRSDIARLHHRLGKKTKPSAATAPLQGRSWKKGQTTGGPAMANRVLSLLSKMFNLAKSWGFLSDVAVNPAVGIDRFKEVARERYLTADEVKALPAAIDEEPNPFVRAAIRIYLLTGCRKMELLRLKWTDINFERREFYLRNTKTKTLHVMPLTSHVELVLQTLPQLGGNPYVFAGHVTGKHLVSINKNWQDIRKRAGIPDVRIHDLRHTVATWLVSSGMDLALVGRVLGHSDPRTTKRYAHFMLKPVAAALEGHGAEIGEVSKPGHGVP